MSHTYTLIREKYNNKQLIDSPVILRSIGGCSIRHTLAKFTYKCICKGKTCSNLSVRTYSHYLNSWLWREV